MDTIDETETLWRAFERKDSQYEGVFIVAVKTTGICCRPTCRVKPPLRKNVEFFSNLDLAVRAGYRPCKRCRPDRPAGMDPELVRKLKTLSPFSAGEVVEADLQALGIDASTAKRNFQRTTGMTFAKWQKRASEPSSLVEAFIPTPLGRMRAIAADHALLICDFEDRKGLPRAIENAHERFGAEAKPEFGTAHPILERTREQLDQYFKGKRQSFALPVDPPTQPFLRSAWDALLAIPFGETRSYAQQATAIGKPTAVRAVARANGLNYISIIVPCHRVIGSDGSLTGYGGGLPRKKWLIEHERKYAAQPA